MLLFFCFRRVLMHRPIVRSLDLLFIVLRHMRQLLVVCGQRKTDAEFFQMEPSKYYVLVHIIAVLYSTIRRSYC